LVDNDNQTTANDGQNDGQGDGRLPYRRQLLTMVKDDQRGPTTVKTMTVYLTVVMTV